MGLGVVGNVVRGMDFLDFGHGVRGGQWSEWRLISLMLPTHETPCLPFGPPFQPPRYDPDRGGCAARASTHLGTCATGRFDGHQPHSAFPGHVPAHRQGLLPDLPERAARPDTCGADDGTAAGT